MFGFLKLYVLALKEEDPTVGSTRVVVVLVG